MTSSKFKVQGITRKVFSGADSYGHKKDTSGEAFLVVPPGLEPGQAEPKSDVLPLHHGTIPLVLSFEF